MINVNYQKRKNTELFKSLENPDSLFMTQSQNYIPIYNRFFSLNETNFNGINLNNKWYVSSVKEKIDDTFHLYNCKIKNILNDKTKDKELFFKLAPLLDPYKYLIGKYNVTDEKIFTLPKLTSTDSECHTKFIDQNNSAYVDGLFLYLTSQLIHNTYFPHGLDYYGSFLGIKNDFSINVFDDIDYLNDSDFFNKNKNVLFKIDNYDHLFQDTKEKLKPIKINHDTSAKSQLSVQSFDNKIFEDVFEDKMVDLNDLKNMTIDLVDITNSNMFDNKDSNHVTLKSSSTCSSRTSYTADGNIEENNNELENDEDNDDNEEDDDEDNNDDEDDNNDDEDDEDNEDDNEDNEDNEDDEDNEDNEDDDEDEVINVTIPKFPVQAICMEFCENTFDDLIINNELSNDEWYSAFMQIIMILITYQKAFNFTHNDLHTNNIMYNNTEKKYIFYCYKKKYYRVPTFGRIYKIIDFGRSIYKYDGKIFCSDSFQVGGDAASQYNIEPYFNDKKPRLEPNYSFDLCRLACSIFDYLIEDIEEVKDLSKCDNPIKRLIVEWCLDDNGINMLYKNNGTDRYPDFKLYKMIARCVHNHTPQAQLERPEFKAFLYDGNITTDIINIDSIPLCV
jgi:hypothetical protein